MLARGWLLQAMEWGFPSVRWEAAGAQAVEQCALMDYLGSLCQLLCEWHYRGKRGARDSGQRDHQGERPELHALCEDRWQDVCAQGWGPEAGWICS